MRVVEGRAELQTVRRGLKGSLGLVPTMGYLHEGHLSLVRRAKQECASVGVSIFVNPAQFGPNEDLAAYPLDLDRDLRLLEAEKTDVVWTPIAADMYEPGFQTWVEVEQLTDYLEGLARPGHFRGVATVVAKLFNNFQPDRAYFGQKDAQQAIVIRRMTMDLNFPVEIVVCPTVREPDGLAMSSRNSYLSSGERAAANVLFRALSGAEHLFNAGERRAEKLKREMVSILATETLARPEYVSVADPETLQELQGPIDRTLLSMAVFIGNTRLIDNLPLGDK